MESLFDTCTYALSFALPDVRIYFSQIHCKPFTSLIIITGRIRPALYKWRGFEVLILLHGAPYCGHGYVPLRCGGDVVMRIEQKYC